MINKLYAEKIAQKLLSRVNCIMTDAACCMLMSQRGVTMSTSVYGDIILIFSMSKTHVGKLLGNCQN